MQHDEKLQWESEWSRHACWLRTVLRARLRNSNDTDEVLQDVAVLAWRKRTQLDDENRIEPWLYRIAIRQVLMFWRKQKRNKNHVTICSEVELKEDNCALNPADWICRNEAHELVRTAMQNLPAQDREILLLKHVEAWTYEQISDRLGISYDKVVYRLSRARNRLRNQLAATEMEENP